MLYMNMIHCTCSCIYQEDGYCRLNSAARVGGLKDADTSSQTKDGDGCLYVRPQRKKEGGPRPPQPTELPYTPPGYF